MISQQVSSLNARSLDESQHTFDASDVNISIRGTVFSHLPLPSGHPSGHHPPTRSLPTPWVTPLWERGVIHPRIQFNLGRMPCAASHEEDTDDSIRFGAASPAQSASRFGAAFPARSASFASDQGSARAGPTSPSWQQPGGAAHRSEKGSDWHGTNVNRQYTREGELRTQEVMEGHSTARLQPRQAIPCRLSAASSAGVPRVEFLGHNPAEVVAS